jgi:hypothetical protein
MAVVKNIDRTKIILEQDEKQLIPRKQNREKSFKNG